MATSYSDPPSGGYSDSPSAGYSDFPVRASTDPPDDDDEASDVAPCDLLDTPDSFQFAAPKDAVKVPPVTSFLGHVDIGNPWEMYVGDGSSCTQSIELPTRVPYSDNPNTHSKDLKTITMAIGNQLYHDEELNSVFVNGAGPSSSSSTYHRKTLGVCFLGFLLGIVMMIAFVLITHERNGFRLGAPVAVDGSNNNINGYLDGRINHTDTNPIGEIDGNGRGNNQDTIGVWVAAEPETAEINESTAGEPKTAEINQGDKTEETPANDIGQEASSGETVESNNDIGSNNANNGIESEDSFVVTLKNQEAAKNEPAQGEDEAHNNSAPNEPAAVTNEESSNSAKQDQANADAPQTPHDDDSAAPEQTEEKVDVSKYCGACAWKQSGFTCDQRVQNLRDRFKKLSSSEAKTNLMKQGHCPEKGGGYVAPPTIDPSLPTIDDSCRKRPRPGEDDSLDNFCGLCQWGYSEFNCFKRVAWLKGAYGTPDKVAMHGLMDQGHCKDETTEEEKEKNREQGIELWCGYCPFRSFTCDYRAKYSSGGGANSTQLLVTQLDLMANGVCTLPPYCDPPPSTPSPTPNGLEPNESVAPNNTNVENTTEIGADTNYQSNESVESNRNITVLESQPNEQPSENGDTVDTNEEQKSDPDGQN